MSPRRPSLLRTVGTLALVGLLALNVWLLALNVAKHNRAPDTTGDGPALGPVDGTDGSLDTGGLLGGDDGATPFSADGTTPGSVPGPPDPVIVAVDRWPGGRGPVPDGPPARRRVLVTADGGLRVVGSAPEWSVVTELVAALGRRLGRPSSTIEVDVSWHPEASDRPGDGEAVVERPLRYGAGLIELPDDGPAILAPVVDLLVARPELYVVVVGLIDEGQDAEAQAAVVLGRTEVVADEFEANGIEPGRVVTSVAPAGPPMPPGEVPAGEVGVGPGPSTDGRVVVRIENLLAFGSVG